MPTLASLSAWALRWTAVAAALLLLVSHPLAADPPAPTTPTATKGDATATAAIYKLTPADLRQPRLQTMARIHQALSAGRVVVLSHATFKQAQSLFGFPVIQIGRSDSERQIGQSASQRISLGALAQTLSSSSANQRLPSFTLGAQPAADDRPHVFAVYITKNGRIRLFEGLGTKQSGDDDRGSLQRWVSRVRATQAQPGPPRRDNDPISFLPNSYTELFFDTVSWSDDANTEFDLDIAAFRANTFSQNQDYYALTTSLTSIVNGFVGTGCGGYGQCGPFLGGRSIDYYSSAPMTEVDHGPTNTSPGCTQSFSIGSSLSANIGASLTGPSVGESLGITENDTTGCSETEYSITDNSTISHNEWDELLGNEWIVLGGPPPALATSTFVADQGAIFAAPSGSTFSGGSAVGSPETILVGTHVASLWTVNCGFLGLGYCAGENDYYTSISVWFDFEAPVFLVTPQAFNLCVPASTSSSTNNMAQYGVVDYIPGPSAEDNVSTIWTWSPTNGGSTVTNNITNGANTTLSWPGGSMNWQPYFGLSPYASEFLLVNGSGGQSGGATSNPSYYPLWLNYPAPPGETLQFYITTNPTNAAPSEDFQAPNGIPMSVTGWGPPTISSVSPSTTTHVGGWDLSYPAKLSGTGFFEPITVTFGNAGLGNVQSVSPDGKTLFVWPPSGGNGSVPVTVATNCGANTYISGLYTFRPGVHPRARLKSTSAIAPNAAKAGDTITISGSGFNNATRVAIGGTAASSFQVAVSGESITATVPDLGCVSGPVDIKVTTPVGTSLSNDSDVLTYSTPASPRLSSPRTQTNVCRAVQTVGLGECEQCLATPWWGLAVYVPSLNKYRTAAPACPDCGVARADWAIALAHVFDLKSPAQPMALADLPSDPERRSAIQKATQVMPFYSSGNSFKFFPDNLITYRDAVSTLETLITNDLGQGSRSMVSTAVTKFLFQAHAPISTRTSQQLTQSDAVKLLQAARTALSEAPDQ